MHAILIWFDHLPYGVPGCCGNTEARTPGFDHFAAGSVTFDNCFVDDRRGDSAAGLVDALLRLQDEGITLSVLSVHPTHLIGLLNRHTDSDADSAIRVEMLNDDDQLMQRITSAVAESSVVTATSGSDEPRAVTVVSLPGVVDSERAVIDDRLESADQLLDRLAMVQTGERTLLLVTAGSAHVSAEQGRELNERMIHVPLLGRSGPPLAFGLRSPSLVALSDVPAALLCRARLSIEGLAHANEVDRAAHAAALLREVSGERVGSHRLLLLRGPDGTVGMRTGEWYLTSRVDANGGTSAAGSAVDQAALYVKPDDLWDSLDVASQWPDVVEELAGMLVGGAGKSGEAP